MVEAIFSYCPWVGQTADGVDWRPAGAGCAWTGAFQSGVGRSWGVWVVCFCWESGPSIAVLADIVMCRPHYMSMFVPSTAPLSH